MFQLSPVVYGSHFPAHPFHPAAAPSAAAVPLMIGTNLDEAAMFVAADPKRRKLTEEDLIRRLTPMLGDRLERVLATYKRTRPDAMSIRLAERKAEGGTAPVFLYLFTWQSDYLGGLFKAAHALEIPFVFDNWQGAPITGARADRRELADLMSETWLAFARNGDPNHSAIPAWRPYTKERRDTFIFDVPPRAEQAPRSEELEAWGDFDARRYGKAESQK
jgi:para-nitrobenzyl esterase